MRKFIYFLLWGLLFCSCEPRWEIGKEARSWVRFRINWPELQIVPQGATLIFYPQTRTDLNPVVYSTNLLFDSVSLVPDDYEVLIFNESYRYHEKMEFAEMKDYTKASITCKSMDVKSAFDLPNDVRIIDEPSVLAVGTHDRIEIAKNNIHSVNQTIDLYPKNYNISIRLIVHIGGIENLATTGSYAATGGLNLTVNMSEQSYTPETGILFCDINNRTIDQYGSGTGILTRQFRSIGFPLSDEFQKDLNLYLKLRNGDDFPIVKRNVTHMIRLADDGVFEIEVGRGTSDDPLINLPDVPGNNTEGPGMDAGVNDWGDEQFVDIPV